MDSLAEGKESKNVWIKINGKKLTKKNMNRITNAVRK